MVVLSKEKLEEVARTTLWNPELEKDNCGVGFIASIKGEANHKILAESRIMLERMAHRGACGCDNDSGDGSGVMTAIPDKFYRNELKKNEKIDLPPLGKYATGILFLNNSNYKQAKESFMDLARGNNLNVICWRKLKTNSDAIGFEARKTEPCIRQVFVTADFADDTKRFDNALYVLRKQCAINMVKQSIGCYICTLSTTTIVYKGQFSPYQLFKYYDDLTQPEFETHMSMVHSRFSTNTLPSWSKAQPNRIMAHNGEINTLRGNKNFMHAREGVMKSDNFGNNLQKLYPVIEHDMTDSGCFDNVLEFLVKASERNIDEATLMMIPEAWEKNDELSKEIKNFYRWTDMLMEPWDGPALVTFSDGRYIGAILDRNGLRPARYYLTSDDYIYLSSEVGVNDIPIEKIIKKDTD
uniref:Glutamine amidotransferase type-2 domain-containing protein n=1 Tax=Rhabditophanes sp. KR3021 TaxID=114890 RepID=A0AC35U6V7_9BILA